VCLRVDRLRLDALDEALPLGPVRLGVHVETADALPDAGHVGEGTEILQGMGVDVGRLCIDVVGIVAHLYRSTPGPSLKSDGTKVCGSAGSVRSACCRAVSGTSGGGSTRARDHAIWETQYL